MSDDDFDYDDLYAIEEYYRELLTPEEKAFRLAWIMMAVALKPEIELGSRPRDADQ